MERTPEDMDHRPTKRPRLSPTLVEGTDIVESQAVSKNVPISGANGQSNEIELDPKELEVGISTFVAQDTMPFHAVLKKRYTDFLVNEISPNGQIVHLTDTNVPEKFQTKGKAGKHKNEPQRPEVVPLRQSQDTQAPDQQGTEAEETKANQAAASVESHTISDPDKQQMIDYLNDTAVAELLSLYEATFKYPTRQSKEHPIVRTEFTSDRSRRAEIHGAIRRIFAARIESTTDKEGVLVLTAADPRSRSRKPKGGNDTSGLSFRSGKADWAERGGEYLHFTLYKENKDTMEAISGLVRLMKLNAKTFQFAGTKDRRAATAQRVSAHRVEMARLASQNRNLRNISLGNFEYHPLGLELGDLEGNEFTLTLRECQFPTMSGLDHAEKVLTIQKNLQVAMDNLHNKGYLNYFGLQRFGTFVTRTDEVGLHILQGDFEAACKAILSFDPAAVVPVEDAVFTSSDNRKQGPPDDNLRATALQLYQQTSNLHKTLEILPRRFNAENTVLRALHKQPSDHLNALMQISRNLRLMYVHAYQSLVWNAAATNRWNTSGNKVTEGDLVLVSEHKDKENNAVTTSSNDNNTPAIDADGEIIINPAVEDRSTNDDFERARPLTATEASSGKYTVFDLVLPLPGFDIVYPSNPSGEFYKTFMADPKKGGGLDPYAMRRKQRDFSLSGSYRKILGRIGADHHVDVKEYTRDEEQFVVTDLEKLKISWRGKSSSNNQNHNDLDEQDEHNDNNNKIDDGDDKQEQKKEEEEETKEKKIAAILRFKLGASQYATMALRELSHGGIGTYRPEFNFGKG